MGRVPQDTGEERLIGEEELIVGLRGAGAELSSTSSAWFPTSCRPAAARRGSH